MANLFTRIGAEAATESSAKKPLTERIAADFTAFLDGWHSAPETFDDELDAQIHRWYSDILSDSKRKVWPPRNIPYFSPSSAKSDARGLYEKLRGGKRDCGGQAPHQGRWTRIGTAVGDVIQRDILFAEKHYAGVAGETPVFSFERNARGEPFFEDFAKTSATFTHNGETFALYGTCDGIMRYTSVSGRTIRVGLEVKSKQTTAAKTSDFSTRNGPEEGHVKQCVCYSLMYGTDAEPIDYYVILCVNAAKKAWDMTAEDYAKNPDIKAFCIEVTDDMRREVLDHFAGITRMVRMCEAPPLDLAEWAFNGYKRACALSLSAEEYEALERQVSAVQRSGLKDHEKRKYAEAFAEITKIREGA